MKRKVLSLVFAILFCMAFSLQAFAVERSETGTTSSGSSGTLKTSASLTVTVDSASARTTAGSTDGVTLSTTVTLNYLTATTYQPVSKSGTGAGSAIVGCSERTGTGGSSSHYVNGGSRWGSWSASLSITL